MHQHSPRPCPCLQLGLCPGNRLCSTPLPGLPAPPSPASPPSLSASLSSPIDFLFNFPSILRRRASRSVNGSCPRLLLTPVPCPPLCAFLLPPLVLPLTPLKIRHGEVDRCRPRLDTVDSGLQVPSSFKFLPLPPFPPVFGSIFPSRWLLLNSLIIYFQYFISSGMRGENQGRNRSPTLVDDLV